LWDQTLVQRILNEHDGAAEPFVKAVHEVDQRLSHLLETWGTALHEGNGIYALCIGSTSTSDIDGISAAGADGDSRRLTPAIDAEALVLGRPVSAAGIPVSPAGVVSPVVISRAMMDLVRCRINVFDCGAFVPPALDCVINVGGQPARGLDTGQAQDEAVVRRLFERGRSVGSDLADREKFVIIGECVPAGTTTALAVLTAMGFPAAELVSSSMPRADRDLRTRLVDQGLANAGLAIEAMQKDPMLAIAAVGDPMQAFVCGLVLEASRRIPVVLGGGTQMLTVFALMQAVEKKRLARQHKVAVITTKWVAFDPYAAAGKLASLLDAPFAAACPNFHLSRHAGLRSYEEGNVKEGVGAGAMMAAAYLTGNSESRIISCIDDWYDKMVPHLDANA
jgi:uncharacterized protein (TIGR00303 family)